MPIQLLAVYHDDIFVCDIFLSLSSQTSLKLEKQKAHHYERKYIEARICCEERGKRLEDTEKKLRQLQESMTR